MGVGHFRARTINGLTIWLALAQSSTNMTSMSEAQPRPTWSQKTADSTCLSQLGRPQQRLRNTRQQGRPKPHGRRERPASGREPGAFNEFRRPCALRRASAPAAAAPCEGRRTPSRPPPPHRCPYTAHPTAAAPHAQSSTPAPRRQRPRATARHRSPAGIHWDREAHVACAAALVMR